MKVAVIGIEDFCIGKRKLSDERIEKLAAILHPSKITNASLEFVSEDDIQNSDAIIVSEAKKLDLIINDLELLEEKLAQESGLKETFERAKGVLEKEGFLSEILGEDDKKLICGYSFCTLKPILVVKNEGIDFDEATSKIFEKMGMICFFTGANSKELSAWPIKKGTNAYEASGKIHSDIQRGFIKAEIIKSKDLIEYGHLNEIKTRGLMSLKDKDYIVEDGDLITFRFNV